MASQKKKLQVDEIVELLKSSPHFAVVKFEGVPHMDFEKLRKELKTNKARLKIVKKSLFEKAINKLASSNKTLKELKTKVFPMRENSALLTLGDDYALGLRTVSQLGGDKGLSFKFALLDDTVYLADETQTIANLPAKDQLIAKILGSLTSAQTRLVWALKYNTQKLVHTLGAIQTSKGGDQ